MIKRCPTCNRTYSDENISFCLADGALLSAPLAKTEPPPTEMLPPALEIPDFEIVPRLGLVFAAIAAVAIVVLVAVNELWPLVFLHVSFGAAWTIVDLNSAHHYQEHGDQIRAWRASQGI